MTVRELVVKLVLDSLGFRERVQDAQGELDKLGTTSKEATDKAARGMDKAADKADDLGGKAREAGKSMQQAAERGERGFDGLLGTLGKVAVALGGFAAIKSTVSGYVQAVGEIEKTSDMLGMSMEEWQGWAYAAKQAGLEAEDVRDRFMDLGDWMTDLNVNDAGPLKDFTEKTKTSFKTAKGATVSMEEGLMRLADTVGKMDRQQATSWLQQIGFDEKTTPLILKGRKAIEEYIKVGKEQALYTKRDAENARRMREAWQSITYVYNAVSGAILRALGPAFDSLAEKAGKVSTWVRENEDSLLVFIATLAAAIAVKLTPALWGMATAAAAALWPFAPLILGALALAEAFDDLWAFASGGNSILENLMRAFGATDKTVEEFRQTVRSAVGFVLDLWDALTGNEKDSQAALERVKAQVKAVADAISNFVRSIGQWVEDLLPQWIKDLLIGDSKPPASAGKASQSAGGGYDGLDAAATGGVGPLMNYRAGDAARPAGGNVTNNRKAEFNVQNMTVVTNAQTGEGTGRELARGFENQVAQADGANGV